MTRPRHNESGMALVMVMGVLAPALVLVAHLMTVSELITKEAYSVSSKGLMRYQAESAAEVSFWLHLTDRRLFSDRTLGQTEDDDFRAAEDFPPWMLDGRPHFFDEDSCVVYMNSGESGIRADNLTLLKQGLNPVDDADVLVEIDDFIAAYNDYVDSDDLRSLNGYEVDDYAAEGFYTLPRNGPMEFKAELYWLPDWANVITGEIATLPPMRISYKYPAGSKTSIFSATAQEICFMLGIDEGSADFLAIQEALKRWREDGTPLEESLDATLLISLQSRFSFTEAGVAVVEANAYDRQREIMSGYRVVREAKMSSRTFFADKKKECLSVWERKWR